MLSHRRSRQAAAPRRGAALVELAICLPLIVMLTMATIEACTMLYLKQSLKIAAFEGCRVGLVPGATTAHVQAQVQEILNSRGVRKGTVTMTPADPTTLQSGDIFRVDASASCSNNTPMRGWFFSNKQLSEKVEMFKDN